MNADMLPLVLLADFNSYRARTQGHFKLRQTNPFATAPLKATVARVQLFRDLVAWCREHELDPRQWVVGLFRVRQWKHAPKTTPGCLMSARLIPKIKRLPPSKALNARVMATSEAAQAAAQSDPRRDLLHHVEARKATLAEHGLHASCFASVEETLGFHPRSATCRACPLQGDCAVRLCSVFPFDILGLRQTAAEL